MTGNLPQYPYNLYHYEENLLETPNHFRLKQKLFNHLYYLIITDLWLALF